jgi:hypothetical protein
MDVAPVTILSGAVAALVCPVVSLMTPRSGQIPQPDHPGVAVPEAPASWGRTASLWVLWTGLAVVLAESMTGQTPQARIGGGPDGPGGVLHRRRLETATHAEGIPWLPFASAQAAQA